MNNKNVTKLTNKCNDIKSTTRFQSWFNVLLQCGLSGLMFCYNMESLLSWTGLAKFRDASRNRTQDTNETGGGAARSSRLGGLLVLGRFLICDGPDGLCWWWHDSQRILQLTEAMTTTNVTNDAYICTKKTWKLKGAHLPRGKKYPYNDAWSNMHVHCIGKWAPTHVGVWIHTTPGTSVLFYFITGKARFIC